MSRYIINHSQSVSQVKPIIFTQDNSTGLHYPHCDVLVVRAIVSRNGLKHMLIDNGSLINILFSSTYDKMLVDHNLTPMNKSLYGFTGKNIIPRERINLLVEMGTPH